MLKADEEKPKSVHSEVTMHYEGTLLDGTLFDSSITRGETTTFPLTELLKIGL